MRTWKPLSAKRLKAIVADTEKDCPDQMYTADEVYRLARELEQARRTRLILADLLGQIAPSPDIGRADLDDATILKLWGAL